MVRVESIGIDGVVIATVAGLVLICALFAGLIPVLASRSENLLAPLQESSRGSTSGPSRTGVRKVLVGAEVAFTVANSRCSSTASICVRPASGLTTRSTSVFTAARSYSERAVLAWATSIAVFPL